MRRGVWAACAALVLWGVGCGGGGASLPGDNTPPGDNNPGLPVPPVGNAGGGGGGDGSGTGDGDGDGDEQPAALSLWPLTVGSTWTYRVTDSDAFGTTRTSKTVVVEALEDVPGLNGVRGVRVRSDQPEENRREISWQVETGGLVFRAREEDWTGDGRTRLRSTTWAPATVKNVAAAQPTLGLPYLADSVETRSFPAKPAENKDRSYRWEVLERDVRVETPAGVFTNAVKVRRSWQKARDDSDPESKERVYWLVPGVGKVREEGERTEELLSHDVKAP